VVEEEGGSVASMFADGRSDSSCQGKAIAGSRRANKNGFEICATAFKFSFAVVSFAIQLGDQRLGPWPQFMGGVPSSWGFCVTRWIEAHPGCGLDRFSARNRTHPVARCSANSGRQARPSGRWPIPHVLYACPGDVDRIINTSDFNPECSAADRHNRDG